MSIELPEYAIFIKLPEFHWISLDARFPDVITLAQMIERWCFAKNGGKRENFAKQTTKKSSAFVKLKQRYHRFRIKPK